MLQRLIELLDQNCGYVEEQKAQDLADYLIKNGVIIPPVKIGDTMYGISRGAKMTYEKETPYAIQVEVSDKIEKQIKSEAIKEFAERLKIKVKMYNSEDVDEGDLIDDLLTVGETVEIIDNLAKEMMEV